MQRIPSSGKGTCDAHSDSAYCLDANGQIVGHVWLVNGVCHHRKTAVAGAFDPL